MVGILSQEKKRDFFFLKRQRHNFQWLAIAPNFFSGMNRESRWAKTHTEKCPERLFISCTFIIIFFIFILFSNLIYSKNGNGEGSSEESRNSVSAILKLKCI